MAREPGEWVPAGHRGQVLEGGKVSQEDRWWPARWWRGHWLERRSCGRWRDADGPYRCAHHGGHDGPHKFVELPPDSPLLRGRRGRQSDASRGAVDYKAYQAARHDAADAATRGNLLNDAGRARGIAAGSFFTSRPASMKWASEELRDWMREHGPGVSAAQYRAQHDERAAPPKGKRRGSVYDGITP